jgi:hypothetical protein
MTNKKQENDYALTKLENFNNYEELKRWANFAINSGLLPESIETPEAAMTIVQHGKELGLSPFVSL